MQRIEDLLYQSKPEVPLLPEGFSQLVLTRIIKLGLSPVLVKQKTVLSRLSLLFGSILLVTGIFFSSFVSFEISAGGSLELLDFGNQFLGAFLSYLPLDTILTTLLITSLSAYLIWNSHKWKVTLGKLILSLYFSIVAGGAAIASTGLNEQIFTWATNQKDNPGLIGRLYQTRPKYQLQREDFQLGRVTGVGKDYVWISDPLGQKTKILLPKGLKLSVDQFVKFAGQTKDNVFQAEMYKPCNTRRVNRYFSHMKMHSQHMSGRKGMHRMMMRGQ